MQHFIDQFIDIIHVAAKNRTPLYIRGGGCKDFYGNYTNKQEGEILNTTVYSGIVDYDPAELVLTARAGTRLIDLETELNARNQMLAFEPPYFGSTATLGGCIASGLAGPRRASVGAARDFVLGVRMLDGKGNDLHFGGQVMKNVAGYDISRLMTGSMGTLGLLLEISLKVLPLPRVELTLRMEMKESDAIKEMNIWASKPLPISATCFYNNELTLRLSGAESAVHAASKKLGGEKVIEDSVFWESIREQTHAFFQSNAPLWRLSIKSSTPPLLSSEQQLIEWGGALRWLICNVNTTEDILRVTAETAGGHATLFRNNRQSSSVFHPLAPEMERIHRRLKKIFDPMGILNPGRTYQGL
ncbi:MAG: glycolate oxidase subunit GlcE [Nitrosospira sp.]|nr:glycolate oxidase subunit GlcE [Nitrosospira sp.]